MTTPLVTLAFLSWNRLHYLRATLESARRCIRYPNLEWIVSDNESVEPGLRDYLEGLDWIQQKWSRTQTHADAMNEIVDRARGKYVLIWPEDVQFVVEGDWMGRLVATMEENPFVGSVVLNFLRRKTVNRLCGSPKFSDIVPMLGELRRRRSKFRVPQSIEGPCPLTSLGWRLPGIVGSGIPSLTRVATWKALGPWRAGSTEGAPLIDSSLGAEDDMIERFQRSGSALQQALMRKPVAADIINDELGSKAKVRRGKRYGIYEAPTEGGHYYEILREGDLPDSRKPLAFEDWVKPRGFSLPLGPDGGLLKQSINMNLAREIS